MIDRYTDPQMAKIWSDESRFDLWLEIELLVCEAQARRGRIPKRAFQKIRRKARWNRQKIQEIEARVKHDLLAFVANVSSSVGQEGRYIHMGLTSSDVLDTAFGCQLSRAGLLLKDDLKKIVSALKKKANKYQGLAIMGRTHGVHAQPTSLGLKFAAFGAEFKRHEGRLAEAIKNIRVGKLSGAVGNFAHVSPDVEREVCRKLGLVPDPVSTQVVSRDRHAFFFLVLAGIAATVEKLATEIRLLQQTEISELAEPFSRGQKGSSAMPHKRNPILCENLCGLSRVVKGGAQAALENVVLWHERDISHSSAERVIAPDATIALDFMLRRLLFIIEKLDVFEDNIRKNLDSSLGLYASQDLLVHLTKKGWGRERAYGFVQEISWKAREDKKSLKDLCLASKELNGILSPAEIGKIFDLKRHTKWARMIISRAFD